MGSFLLRGFLIGVVFGVPAGAVGAMTVQRTLAHGVGAGLLSGLGSSAADCLYACAGAFGLTVISEFLLENQRVIHILGGSLVLLMGIRLLLKDGNAALLQKGTGGAAGIFLSSFAVGIANPAAVLSFLFAFSCFGIPAEMGPAEGIVLVLGVFLGTMFWWSLLTAGTWRLKMGSVERGERNLNKGFSVILILFGLIVLSRAVI